MPLTKAPKPPAIFHGRPSTGNGNGNGWRCVRFPRSDRRQGHVNSPTSRSSRGGTDQPAPAPCLAERMFSCSPHGLLVSCRCRRRLSFRGCAFSVPPVVWLGCARTRCPRRSRWLLGGDGSLLRSWRRLGSVTMASSLVRSLPSHAVMLHYLCLLQG